MKHFSSLYWKLSGIFLLILLVYAVISIGLTVNTARDYFQEANQRLDSKIAQHIAKEIKPFTHGQINDSALRDLFHNVMVLHPSVEVYLLDDQGEVLAYAAPDSLIKMDKVDVTPIREFIDKEGDIFIKGDNPRDPDRQKIFSAAEIHGEDVFSGFIYVILRGDRYDSATAMLLDNYPFNLALKMFLILIAGTLVLGLIAFFWVTKPLNDIINHVKRFERGNWNVRVPLPPGGSGLKKLAQTINHMADTISSHIEKRQAMELSRQELIANVSHDLRTPLSTIKGYTETLQLKIEELPLKEKKKYIRIILSSIERLERLVNDLFDLSKLEAKRVELDKEPFHISELLLDNVQKYKITAEEKNIELETDIPDDLPLIYADVGLIDRVLQNLLDNALKFTHPGGKITAGLRRQNGGVEIRIADTGIGIPSDELQNIFKRYTHTPNGENIGGSGLGLTITKKILDLHESSIQVNSVKSEGSQFYFTLPIHKDKS